MNIALCTDDLYMSVIIVRHFRNKATVTRVTREQCQEEFRVFDCLIIGLPKPELQDWKWLRSLPHSMQFRYLMVDVATMDVLQEADKIGFCVLIDPMSDMESRSFNAESALEQIEAEKVTCEPVLYELGYGCYFHADELWIGMKERDEEKVVVKAHWHLTSSEANLLFFFIRVEGKVVTRNYIEEAIWHGDERDASTTIKLVNRLKKKMGPAKETIISRKAGGYLFKRNLK